jgi:hypothetical protein
LRTLQLSTASARLIAFPFDADLRLGDARTGCRNDLAKQSVGQQQQAARQQDSSSDSSEESEQNIFSFKTQPQTSTKAAGFFCYP